MDASAISSVLWCSIANDSFHENVVIAAIRLRLNEMCAKVAKFHILSGYAFDEKILRVNYSYHRSNSLCKICDFKGLE